MSFLLSECPICSGNDLREIYDTRDRHYGIPGIYRIVKCSSCSLVFLNPMSSDAELASLYPKDYYAYQNNFKQRRWKQLIQKLVLYRLGTRDPQFSAPGRMLDLGCGSGWYLSTMRDKGWETFGVEINHAAASVGREQAGLNIFSGTIEKAQFPSQYFDYVRSNHSFEHISRPRETLYEIHRVLRTTGKLLIGVPNVDGLNAKIFGKFWWYLGAPVHPFNYSFCISYYYLVRRFVNNKRQVANTLLLLL